MPDTYAPLDYVEATGTQYVKTHCIPNERTRVVAEYQLTVEGRSDNYIFGSYSKNSNWNANFFFWFYQAYKSKAGYAGVGYPGHNDSSKKLTYDLERHVVDFNRGKVSVDGVDLGLDFDWAAGNVSGAEPSPIYLFARNPRIANSVENICPARIYSFMVYDGDDVVANFVPVVRIADEAPGFYDHVSGRFYGSAVEDKLVAGDYVSLPDDWLEITAEPYEMGSPTPAYGTNTAQSSGLQMSAPSEIVRPDGDTKFRCTGWKLYRLDAETHAWTFESSGTDSSFVFDPPSPAAPRKLVWQYDEYTISLTAGEHGTISYESGYYKDGDIVSVTVTPDSGYAFYKWDTEEGVVLALDPDILLKGVVRARAIFAPVIDLEPGTDVISAAIAARFESDGDVPTVFRLSVGNYSESGSEHAVWLTNAYHVVGAGSNPEDVVVTRTASSANVFYLNHPDAEVRHVMIKGGVGGTNKQPKDGGNVGIGELGGTLVDCVVASGSLGTYNSAGGNIFMQAGLVSRCVVTNGNLTGNNQGNTGGGICASGSARIENSLIGWNTQKCTSGVSGVALYGKAQMVNCTIVGNGNNVSQVGAVKASDVGTLVVNCAIFDNQCSTTGNETWGGWQESFVNCASSDAINGYCIGTPLPAFNAPSQRDYSLTVASPLRNAGFDYCLTAASSASDLAGAVRLSQSSVDIGAYEFVSSGMSADFTVDVAEGLTPHSVRFSATVEGGTGALAYGWDFDGDGTIDETTEVPFVDHIYTIGNIYTVKLTVNDGSSSVTATHADMVKTCQKDVFVAPVGTSADKYPYVSWEDASDSIQDAIDAAVPGCVVHVAAGDYPLTAALSLKKAIRIEGHTGNPADVVIHTNDRNYRALYVDAAGSMVANCMLDAHFYGGNGRVVIFENTGGAISNCIVVGNSKMSGGTIGYSSSALISATRALVTHTIITGYCRNHLSQNQYGPSAVSLNTGSRFENSLVTRLSGSGFSNEDSSGGSIVRASGGSSVVNCTIVACTNEYKNACVLNVDSTSAFTNCVVVGNICTNNVELPIIIDTVGDFQNCAFDSLDLPNDSCRTVTSAAFKDYANGDYTPAAGGALVDSGVTPDGWAGITDLAGKKRVVGSAIDIGAYELQAPSQPKGVLIIYR